MDLRVVARHPAGTAAAAADLAVAAAVETVELERDAPPVPAVWRLTFSLHPSAAVTERAAALVAARCVRAGVGLLLRFDVPREAGRVLRLPPLPLAAFADVPCLAVEVPASHYVTDRCTLALPSGVAMAGASALALHREVDAGHCGGDAVLASLDAVGPPAALAHALARALSNHAEHYLLDALARPGGAAGRLVVRV